MQIKNLFRENMLLEVYDNASGVYFKSLLQGVDDDSLAIGIPMKDGKSLALRKGSVYLCRVPLEDALYYFRSEIDGERKGDRVPLYLLSWPDHVERRQRREYYRLECSFDVEYWVLTGNTIRAVPDNRVRDSAGGEATDLKMVAPEMGDGEWNSETRALYKQIKAEKPRRGVAANISGGGLLLVTRHSLQPGASLALRFFLQSNGMKKKEILVQGRVIRVVPFKLGKLRHYRCGVKFWKMSERVRDIIIRFIFSMLRQRLR